MISQRPYFIRAMYEWILDNDWTPYVQVDATWPGVQVPRQFVDEEGVIVLNIGPSAVRHLELDNDEIRFHARFQGREHVVSFPPEAVVAIFSKETGVGMPFPPEPKPASSASEEAVSSSESDGVGQPDRSATDERGEGGSKVIPLRPRPRK